MVLSLIQNVALIVALATAEQYLVRALGRNRTWLPIVSGSLFGGVAVIAMMTPFVLTEGLIFDGRSVILSIAGLFGGPLVAGIAAGIAAAYRYSIGGVGAFTGVMVIVISALIGVIFHSLRHRYRGIMDPWSLWGFGLLVHVSMLLTQVLLLPGGIGLGVVREIGPVVIVLFPVATVLVTRLMLDQEEREDAARALERTVAERTEELQCVNVELREALAARDLFFANVSHELRTPLNSIIGFSGMLAGGMVGFLTDEQHTQVSIVRDSGNHLLGLIDQLLDLAKIRADKVTVTIESFDAAALLCEVGEMLSPLAAEKGLDLRIETPSHEVEFHSDSRKVKQMLLNLLGNGIKFTEHGSVVAVLESGPSGGIRVTVTDTGPGISKEDLKPIFDAFVRGSAGDAPGRASGTGLGLTISREFAQLLGGDITVESEPGVGSTFVLALPPGDAANRAGRPA